MSNLGYQAQNNTYGFYKDMSKLSQNGSIAAEYVWIDGTDISLRAKSRTLTKKINSIADLPDWNYDGSSCYQASTHNSEVILKPVAMFHDPFRQGEDNLIVLCESWIWADEQFTTMKPANTNFRHYAKAIFEAAAHSKPWFGIEQEYHVLETKNTFTVKPLGWPSNGFPGPQGAYYCSVGANICFGRSIMDAHYKACLYAGVMISGTNVETMPGQLEFQVGPCEGIAIGDQLWMARYLLGRVAEDFNVTISFDPKLFRHFSGAGGHLNFSTEKMREVGGKEDLLEMLKKLENKHITHMELYGDNSLRLQNGEFETSNRDVFTWGIGDRSASVRIPTFTVSNGFKGYIEDRRPASDLDPYVATAAMLDTTTIEGQSLLESLYVVYCEWKEWKKNNGDIPKN